MKLSKYAYPVSVNRAVAKARKDLSAMRLDKMRMDWLQKNLPHGCCIGTPQKGKRPGDSFFWLFFNQEKRDVKGKTLREVIDKAMKG